jgi:haloalkane dehalogenase
MSGNRAAVLDAHRKAGRAFEAGGVRSFCLDSGDGVPVVCLHGVPASSFLYRKLVVELAARGLRGVAFDFPGLGLADRPAAFDYSWSGLAAWTASALDALGIDKCHLVVHDIGGPIGFEWAIGHPDRVLSLTALNTVADVDGFRRPWPMHPFSIGGGVGAAWLALMRWPVWEVLFRTVGVVDNRAVSSAEISAYQTLLRRGDNGRAFLRIMRGFELTAAKQEFYYDGLAARDYPAQVVWGARDTALGAARQRAVERALGVDAAVRLPARHFLTEDQAPAIADAVAALARQVSTAGLSNPCGQPQRPG